ncbi:MAG: translocation/assembly module TamB domain-containing protein [Rhizobacter sp.]|nr:translocation/assembly module TamB domain-containing protein [Bacteriovorax sp.]
MKRLNKILLVFLVMTFLTLFGGWKFIHSERFSKEASMKVSKILTEKIGAKLNFTGVDFSLFPLSTTFKNVKLSKSDPAVLDVSIEAQELEVAFTYSSFISNELEIDQVSIRNGAVNLNIFKKSDDDTDIRLLKTKEIFAKYNEFLSKVPVRFNLIILDNIKLNIDKVSLMVNHISFSPQKTKVRLKADVTDLLINHDKANLPPISITKAEALVSMDKDEWRVENLKVTKDKNELSMRGVAFNENGTLHLNSNGTFSVNTESIFKDLTKVLPKDIVSIKGDVAGKFESTGIIDDPDASVVFTAKNADTPWIRLAYVAGTVTKKKQLLGVQKLQAINGQEVYLLKRPQTFYDLSKKQFSNFNFSLHLQNAYTDTFLYSSRESLGTLKGSLTGDAEAALFDEKAVFTIKAMQVKNFRLTSKDGKKDILKNGGFDLDNSAITINKDFSVGVDVKASMANTRLKAIGKISSKNIDISVTDSKIDMQALGPVAGVSVAGSGPAILKVSGPPDDVVFNFDVDWNNFSVVELNFGRVKANFSLGLKDLDMEIYSLEGAYNKSNFYTTGNIGFSGKNEGMDLKIDFKNTNFSDARKMFQLVFKKLKLPVIPEFNFEAKYVVKGGFGLNTLNVTGDIKGTELKVSNEEAEKIDLKFTLAKEVLNFNLIKINKARGEINATANINLANNYIELSGASQNLRLRDFNFYRNMGLEYDGDLFLDFDGNGTSDEFSSRFKARVVNAFIGNVPASASNAIFYINSNDIVTNASLLAGKIKIDSLLSFKTDIAAIKMSIDTSDVREFMGIFSGHNISDRSITGRIKAQLNTQISLGSLGVRRFFLNIDQLNIQRGDMSLRIDPKYNNIEVDEGIVKKWDLRLSDGNDFFQSKGRNISNGVIGIEQKFSIKASLLELVTEQIERAKGIIKGTDSIVLDKKINVRDFALFADDLSLKIRNLPGFITNFDYTIVKKGETYEISRMTGNYGEGEFKIGGKVIFDDKYPTVNLDYKIDRSTVPLFKRSSVIISSTGTISGTDLPYRLNGKVSILHGEFLDDPTDFMKDNKVSIDEYKKYLPEKDFLGNKGIIDLNLSFDTVSPVVIKNNMAEVYIRGSGQVTGDIQSPEINTRLETVPNISKFKFKGHDFALNQGYVEIRDRGKNRVSDLKFTGVAKINEYDMKLDLSGSISKVNVDLSSEPALSKEDLLSLLTLGVTSDMSKNLESSERRFVTTVGIGTLLVDQLKINEDLNSSLGVKLSVQPEFKEDETTLISGKSAQSDSNTSRLKSATKIKINKQINSRVDVSLSSTVGGSIEQSQQMNINFNINKNFSLEGIYEVKPTEDVNTNTPNSLGADLKWRKSFSF